MDNSVQNSLIEAIDIIVKQAIENTPYTTSHIGKVTSIDGYDCKVEIYGQETVCKLLEHLKNVIRVGDIVIVQDLYNNKVDKFVQSKIGSA